jgi:hypothetical protein
MVVAGKIRVGTDLGSLPALGTGPGVGAGNGDGRKKFSVFLKSFSLFVIRDIPFLGSPITFFDIPMRTDSG